MEGYFKVLRERANLRTVVAAVGLALLGLFFLWISAYFDWKDNNAAQSVVRDVGSFLSASAVLTFLWEFWGRRAFLDEVLAKVQLSDDVRSAGILKIVPSFHTGIDWQTYFPRARELALTVGELARRFEYTIDALAGYIRDAVETFKKLRSLAGQDGGQIELWFFQGTQQFSYYRFDSIAIVAMYTHRRARDPVPAFVCEEGGSLFEFLRQDFDALVRDGGLARKVELKESS